MRGRPRTAGQRAYEWIRDAILRGDFAEGEFIDEVAPPAQVNTSRTPVREALQRLQVERDRELSPARSAGPGGDRGRDARDLPGPVPAGIRRAAHHLHPRVRVLSSRPRN